MFNIYNCYYSFEKFTLFTWLSLHLITSIYVQKRWYHSKIRNFVVFPFEPFERFLVMYIDPCCNFIVWNTSFWQISFEPRDEKIISRTIYREDAQQHMEEREREIIPIYRHRKIDDSKLCDQKILKAIFDRKQYILSFWKESSFDLPSLSNYRYYLCKQNHAILMKNLNVQWYFWSTIINIFTSMFNANDNPKYTEIWTDRFHGHF